MSDRAAFLAAITPAPADDWLRDGDALAAQVPARGAGVPLPRGRRPGGPDDDPHAAEVAGRRVAAPGPFRDLLKLFGEEYAREAFAGTVADLLSARWPGIRFALPPADGGRHADLLERFLAAALPSAGPPS